MHRKFLYFFIYFLFFISSAKADWRDQIKAMVSHGGVLAVSEKGTPLFMLNIDQKFMPASTLKVATSLLALKELGENFRFPTELYLDSQNILYIKGYGDPFLISEGETEYIYHVDRQGHPLFGLDVKFRSQSNPLYPLYVKTTLDKKMQETVEKTLDAHGVEEGGAVLIDIETNELLAMSSRPLFSSETIYKHVDHMTSQQIPGSIFKIVTAAAAIEGNKIQNAKTYDCDLNIYGEKDERQLGMLNVEDSFTQSCNRTFGELANELQKTDPDYMKKYAEKLGLLTRNGWQGEVYHLESFSHFYKEEDGQIYSSKKKRSDYNSSLAVSQTAIGQLDVKITPLATANMMATIARGGVSYEVKTAKSVNFANDTELIEFEDHKKEDEKLSPYTIMRLQSLLLNVVKDEKGTGHALQTLPFQVAGKSGTAQKGEDKHFNNKWFAGYFPTDQPRYALVIVDLKHDTVNRTIPVFRDIAAEIMGKTN